MSIIIKNTLLWLITQTQTCHYYMWFCCVFQVSSGLLSRVAVADQNFNKEMEFVPRISPEFELTLDNKSVLHAIQTMNFFQMKGIAIFVIHNNMCVWFCWRTPSDQYKVIPMFLVLNFHKINIIIKKKCTWSYFKTWSMNTLRILILSMVVL